MSFSEDDNDNYKQFEIHEGFAFLIELTPEIFLPLKELNNKSQLFEILSSINDLVREFIITLPNTGIGIYFYNCLKTSKKFPKDCGLNRLFKLNDLNSFNMKKLNDTINDDSNGISLLKDTFPYLDQENSEDKLPTVLNIMLNEFHNKQNYNNKKLIWFTNNDKPYRNEKTKHNLWKIINDYDEFRINITPFFLDSYHDEAQTKKKRFDTALFQDIFMNTNYLNNQRSNSKEIKEEDVFVKSEPGSESYNDLVFDGVSKDSRKFKETTLSTHIRSIIFRLKEIKRILFSCDLILSDGQDIAGRFGCSVKGYSIYNHEKLKKFKKIYNGGEELKEVHTNTKTTNERTGEEIEIDNNPNITVAEKNDNAQIRKGFPIGDEEILYLNSKQISYLKNYAFDHDLDKKNMNEDEKDDFANEDDDDAQNDLTFSRPPYLKLLGFRDLSKYQPHYNTSAPIFVSPDMNDGLKTASAEGGYKNSFKTFSSLYQSCVNLNKYGIFFGCIKKNSMPSLYALYPTRVSNSQKSGTNFPEGFFLIRLPWLDDIRSLPDYAFCDEMYLNDLQGSSVPSEILLNFKYLISQFFLEEYRPIDFPNPSLNYFYKIINNELLQEELTSESKLIRNNDITTQRLIDLRERLQDGELSQVLQMLNVHLNKLGNQSVKRPMDSTGEAPKKQKKESPALTEEAVLTAWKSNEWNHFNMSQLRGFCSKYKGLIKLASKKQDLIDNIIKFLDAKYKNN